MIIILGPTATGKSDLALRLAKHLPLEIISADALLVYRGLDIGTAKLAPASRQSVPHHLIDIMDPAEKFSAQQFKNLAEQKIVEIKGRGHIPAIVGGTGLYINALMYDYQMPDVDAQVRQRLYKELAEFGGDRLHQRLLQLDPIAAKSIHPNNHRRVIRALEVCLVSDQPFSLCKQKRSEAYPATWLGLTMPREELYAKIEHRVDQMIAHNLEFEVRQLLAQGVSRTATSMQAIGYKEMIAYIDGDLSLEESVARIKLASRRYAKRQLTWFKRLLQVKWFDVTEGNLLARCLELIKQ